MSSSRSSLGVLGYNALSFDDERSKSCARSSELERSTTGSLQCWSKSVSTYSSNSWSKSTVSISLSLKGRIGKSDECRSSEVMECLSRAHDPSLR
jgi:hypothetical protein